MTEKSTFRQILWDVVSTKSKRNWVRSQVYISFAVLLNKKAMAWGLFSLFCFVPRVFHTGTCSVAWDEEQCDLLYSADPHGKQRLGDLASIH